MRKEINEEQLLNKLDIDDWRHMSKDKLITFISSLPYMDSEVAKSAISQFPEFKNMSGEIVSILRTSLTDAYLDNSKKNQQIYEINSKILDSLDKRLNKTFITPWERKQIIEAMLTVSENINESDKNNKSFLTSTLNKVVAVAGTAVIIGGAILGVNIKKD